MTTYVLKVEVKEEKLSEFRRPIDERCFTTDTHWVCRDYRESTYVKDGKLIVLKHYVNCTQSNKVFGANEYANPQLVDCASFIVEYVYELVPVTRDELLQRMRKIVENARKFRTVLVGELLYAIIHNNRLYVLDFFYDPVLHCTRAVIKYAIPI